jgi:superfamily II DNA or RNA helicase
VLPAAALRASLQAATLRATLPATLRGTLPTTPPGPAAAGAGRLTLRTWQEHALERLSAWQAGPFLMSAAPGAGKTIPSLVFARRLLDAGVVRRVAVVCPTTPLTRQWAEAAAQVGLQLVPDADELRSPAGFDGVAVTYARVACSAARWASQCGERTLVIADEAHHLGEELAWGEAFARAFATTPRWLLLSGTPFRSDQTPIPGVRYENGVACPDVSYSYADAVRDGVCRPVAFIPYDGTLSWQSGDDVIESSFDTVLSGREASRRYRTAISTELADGLPRILRAAHERLEQVRAGGHGDAGGLVVAADGEHARRVAAALRDVTGSAPTIVLHSEARAADKLRAFRHSRERWIVAVNMVSEGVDIPRLRVGVYATAAKTPLIFRQIVGRFVRTLAGRPVDRSYLFLPADRLLREHASEVEEELRHVLRPPAEEAPGALDERAQRRHAEITETPAFVPLDADVAPQLALFGGGPAAPPAKPAHTFGGPSAVQAAVQQAPGEPPAFERRAHLRAKRHGLVSTLGGLDGRSHREINAWLNRETGVARVTDASLQQLERSTELLLAQLDRISRRRAS